jgi:hypothetical protein
MELSELLEELYLSVRKLNRYNGVDKELFDKSFLETITIMHEITDLKQRIDLDEEE